MTTAYVVIAWALVIGMFFWAAYLYFHWSGVDALPMQWGITGRPTWYASRGPALFLFPAMAAVVMAFITFARRGHVSAFGLLVTASLLLSVQALWVLLARRYA